MLDHVDDSLRLAADGIAAAQRDRQRLGRSASSRSGAAGSCTSWAGSPTPARSSKDSSAPRPAIASSAPSTPRASSRWAESRCIRATGACSNERPDSHRGLLEDSTPNFRRQAVWLLALQTMATGDPGAAHGWLCALGEDQRTAILPLFPVDVTDEIPLARIALAAGDDELAAGRRRPRRTGAHSATRGSRRSSRPRPTSADCSRRTSRSSNAPSTCSRPAPRPLARAYALEDLGVARARAGAVDAAIEALDGALVLYTEAGATWDTGRVRSRLRDHGVRRRLVARERAETGWAAMTDSELAVARLVAQGLTNREVAEQLFVSPHTVSSHLRSVFAKLDINSRLALARIAAEHDTTTTR